MKRFIISFLLLCLYDTFFGQSADFSTNLFNDSNCGSVTVTFSIDDTAGIDTYKWEFGNGESIEGVISSSNIGSSSSHILIQMITRLHYC